MNLRPYQIAANEAVKNELRTRKSTLVIQPTGTGKTVQFATLANEWPGRVLVLAHTRELIFQSVKKIADTGDEVPSVEMGELRSQYFHYKTKVTVASKDSMNPKRLQRFQPDHFDLIIVDEAHRSAKKNKTYTRVLDHFGDAKIVGYTATADRGDKRSVIGSTYESVAFEYPIWHPTKSNAIDDGYLVPIVQQFVKVDNLDFSKIKTVAGDFTDTELSFILSQETMLHNIVSPTVTIVGSRQCIVFCATIAHAESVADVLNRPGYSTGGAVAVSGKTKPEERSAAIRAFKAGQIQFLCGCDVFVEGFDAPNCSCVVVCRPTKARNRYAQMVGRGLRTLPGVVDGIDDSDERRKRIAESAKPDLLVLDFVGCSSDLKLTCSVADILANAVPDDVAERAKEIADREPIDATKAIQKAAEELDDEAFERLMAELSREDKEEDERRQRITAQAEYRTREIDPFSGDGSAWRNERQRHVKYATEKQANLLIAFGVSPDTARTASVRQAGAMIQSYKDRGVQPDWSRLRDAKRESGKVAV